MKNRIILCGILIHFAVTIHICKAQFIDNRISLYIGYNHGIFHGDHQIHDGDFTFPSLYPNFKNISGMSFKALYNSYQNISYGVTVSKSFISDWEYENEEFYLGSKLEQQSLAATIQLHKKISNEGILNRCKFYLELSPTIGISAFTSSKELFFVQGTDSITPLTTSDNFFYGLNVSTGIEYAFTQALGTFISYTLQHNRIQSILYHDEHFTASQVNAGFIIKLMKDKRYLYRD